MCKKPKKEPMESKGLGALVAATGSFKQIEDFRCPRNTLDRSSTMYQAKEAQSLQDNNT